MSMPVEQKMWQTVIQIAVRDALKNPEKIGRLATLDQRQADAWLRGGSADYWMICSLAGIDGHMLRERYVAGCVNAETLLAGHDKRKRR